MKKILLAFFILLSSAASLLAQTEEVETIADKIDTLYNRTESHAYDLNSLKK